MPGKRWLKRLNPPGTAHDNAIASYLSVEEKRQLIDLLDRLACEGSRRSRRCVAQAPERFGPSSLSDHALISHSAVP